MTPLVRLERLADPDKIPLLGFDWIEVLWVEPYALLDPRRKDPPEAAEWSAGVELEVKNQYACLTSSGMVRITAEDLWVAVQERNEYVVIPPFGPVE